MAKARVTVTLDESLVDDAKRTVRDGRSESISALVGEALQTRLEHDARMVALREAVDAYEAEHGAIGEEEIEAARDRIRAAPIATASNARRAG